MCAARRRSRRACLRNYQNPARTPLSENFDISLPEWLAKHNKLIFGSLFAIAELFLLWQWSLLRFEYHVSDLIH
jgi:hypothetical protein